MVVFELIPAIIAIAVITIITAKVIIAIIVIASTTDYHSFAKSAIINFVEVLRNYYFVEVSELDCISYLDSLCLMACLAVHIMV